MNLWLLAAAGMMLSLVPCVIACLRGKPVDRLASLEMAGVVTTLLLVLLAQGFHRIPFYDLALTLALLSFGSGLVFARFLERWL
ncbi:MAG: monovalent cation/H+ antiporter complex subunit F [Hyalangium sp.]|uniref:monovalent cation/H+ antiporter complex subunit F n=1 Tax=Hyalangium sp. TaxID=2028555 RepID=UPI00389A1FB3